MSFYYFRQVPPALPIGRNSMRPAGLTIVLSMIGMVMFMAGSCVENSCAQIPAETLQYIPSSFQYVSVINVEQWVRSDFYVRSQPEQRQLGAMGDDLAYLAKITGVDIARDVSYLLAGKSGRMQPIILAYGNFDRKAVQRHIKSSLHANEMSQGIVKYLPTQILGIMVQEGAAFLSDQQIVIGSPAVLEEMAETGKGKRPDILSDPFMSALINNISLNEMFWFAGRSAAVIEKSPVPTPMGYFNYGIQSIAGAFNITDSIVGNIRIKYGSAAGAAGLLNFFKQLSDAAQLQENPEAGLKLLANGYTAHQDDVQTTLSLNCTADMAAKIWYWSRNPIPDPINQAKNNEPPISIEKRSGAGVMPERDKGITNPVVLFNPAPQYTEEARKARAQGVVVLEVVIRKDGTPGNFKIKRGLGYGLDESAINTINSRWRFMPGTKDGKPVAILVNIEVSFRLY
jgi:TonB family protein